MSELKEDLKRARRAEEMTLQVLQNTDTEWRFADATECKSMWHYGDIVAYNVLTGEHLYIDVKDDKTFQRTHNFLSEDGVYWKKDRVYTDGFMKTAKYDYVAYISRNERKIYIIDFAWWKVIYSGGKYKVIQHDKQTTYCYLNALYYMRKYGAIIAEIDIECNYSGSWEIKKAIVA